MESTKEAEPLKSEKQLKTKKTLREKVLYIRDNITVEPVLISFVIPGVIARLATQNLNLDKACRVNLQYEDVVCDALVAKTGTLYHDEEIKVQELIASMEVWKNLILTAIPSFLILFIGGWSDETGNRKICILLPIVGDFLMCLSNILNVYYFYELPLQITMFLEAIFPAMCGGWITTYMGTFSYIAETSNENTRTFRVGIANLCLTVGGPIGTVLSGILLNYVGYYGVFSISSVLYCFSICHGFIYIKNPERPKSEDQKKNIGMCGHIKSFFDIKHVKDTFVVAFKGGPNNRRIKSILILMSIVFIFGPAYGEYTVRYLYSRYRFNWDLIKYSFYNTFYICLHLLGAVISITFFSKRLKWQDATLGIISNVSKVVGSMSTGLARNSFEMYLAVVVEMFNATSFTALRSLSSKLVTNEELGKMGAIFNLTEVVTSMVFGPSYSWIYMVSLKYDAGVIFYLSTIVTLPSIFIFMWFFKQHKKDEREQRKENVKKEIHTTDKKSNDEPIVSSIDLNEGIRCERIITYMFVRYRLKWDALKYSMYSTYSVITHSLGALFSISMFSKHWGFHDSMLCLISVTSKLVGSIYVAFVKTDLDMFMVPIVEILNATTFSSLRSMASKLVQTEEMGKMNSLFSLVETLAALVFDPTYATLYSHTIAVFVGSVFIFSACLTVPAIIILVWFFTQHRVETKLRRKQKVTQLKV